MRNVRCAAAVLGLFLLAGCGDGSTGSSSSRKGDLRIVLPGGTEPVRSGSYDFGAVPVGEPRKVTFDLINIGSDFARVTSKRFEEAEVGAYFAQAPASVPAGASDELSITFQPSQVPGPNDAPYGGRFILEHDGESISVTINLGGTGVPRP